MTRRGAQIVLALVAVGVLVLLLSGCGDAGDADRERPLPGLIVVKRAPSTPCVPGQLALWIDGLPGQRLQGCMAPDYWEALDNPYGFEVDAHEMASTLRFTSAQRLDLATNHAELMLWSPSPTPASTPTPYESYSVFATGIGDPPPTLGNFVFVEGDAYSCRRDGTQLRVERNTPTATPREEPACIVDGDLRACSTPTPMAARICAGNSCLEPVPW
jgi:hypothetical protein